MNIEIRRRKRKSLAFRLTPDGAVVLVPETLDAASPRVQAFIAEALAKLPHADEAPGDLQPDDLRHLIDAWEQRLRVKAGRLQIRAMKNKWGSISTAGTLTLSDDLLQLPLDLVEYVVVHELLHLKFPDHRKGWQVSMGMYLPSWRERAYRLQQYILRRERQI